MSCCLLSHTIVKAMKCRIFSVCLALAMPLTAAAVSEFYVNDGVVNCPPQIPPQVNAVNFVNNNFFSINFTNFLINPPLYKTANTLNFTNLGYMFANYGFQFDHGPTGAGTRKMAENFVNSGLITAGSISNVNLFAGFFFEGFFAQSFLPKIFISATNVDLSSSTTGVGLNGLFHLTGKNVELDRANIVMEGFNDNVLPASGSNFFFFANVGIFDAYWGVGANIIQPNAQFAAGTPTTPFHLVTTPAGFAFRQLSLPAAVPYVEVSEAGTNRFVQVVFLSNTNDAILNNVYFPFNGNIAVEWLAPQTNLVTGEIYTNYLYLTDDFGNFGSNILVQSTFALAAQPTFIPQNFSFFRGGPFNFGTPAASGLPPGTFVGGVVTNEYAAFGAILSPTTQLPGYIPGSVITNLPGRTEIIADGVLNMTHANIAGLNYLRLRATNHFAGSEQAQIVSPYSDIALRTTNGTLAITNLLSPTVPRFSGEVDMWSGRWTNDAAGFRNFYHVLFVDSRLSPTSPARIQDLVLRSTNVAGGDGSLVISDVLNITRSMMLDAERITITTNVAGGPTRAGEINLLSTDILWPASTPRLQYLTNAGTIRAANAFFFGGSRTMPHFSSNFNEPYIAFVNRGTITTEGSLIWADYFENSGSFISGLNFGSVALESRDTRLTNGSFLSLNADISIKTRDLVVSNHLMQAGRKIILSITNSITDTGVSNANNWAVGRGFDLLVKPPTGDLLGTTIFDTAATSVDNIHTWAGEDRGVTVNGFTNNVALGRVILSGGTSGSRFSFRGVGSNQNAIYIDYLDLRNFATNINASGNLSALNIATNCVIYYGQAVAGGISVAERINHSNGDRLRWVFEYAGIYSGTNLVYPDGTTNSFNAALVQSQNIDSDGDGLVNANDPTPILRAQDLALTVAVASQPVVGATVSWITVPDSSNTVYYKTSSGVGDWQVLTNLNVGPSVSGRVSVFDPMTTNGGRYYRVMMAPPQP